MTSIFADRRQAAYPYKFEGSILLHSYAGGTPADPKVADAFIKSKTADSDDLIREEIARAMTENIENGVPADMEAAIEQVANLRNLRTIPKDDGGLYVPGAHLFAAMKEAACVRWPDRKWPPNRKWTKSWFPEHVFVTEDRLHFGIEIPTGTAQSFPKSRFGSSIQYTQYVENAKLDFTVGTDFDFTDNDWADLWLTGETLGLGSSRSQGYGRYDVTRWERV